MSTKKIGVPTSTISPEAADALSFALDTKFPQFKFTAVDGQLVADGPWDLKANVRPAMGTIACWAEGYIQCMVDNAAAIGAYEPPASSRAG